MGVVWILFVFLSVLTVIVGFVWLDKHYVWGSTEVHSLKECKVAYKKEMKYSYFYYKYWTEEVVIGYRDDEKLTVNINTFQTKVTDELMNDYKNRIYMKYLNADSNVIGIFRKK
jgi:hypothetical protein